MKKVIYPGSFDPFTKGHLDIVKRAGHMFQDLVIAIGQNPDKKYMFSVPERVRMIQDATKHNLDKNLQIEVLPFSWMLVDFVFEQWSDTVVRGIRWGSDQEAEALLHRAGETQKLGIDTALLIAKQDHIHVASSVAKAVLKEQGIIDSFVTMNVKHFLEARMMGQYIVGLTGTIGSGKSYVTQKFVELGNAQHIPAHNIDLDKIGHWILEEANENVYKILRWELVNNFGSEIQAENWYINKKILGKIIFEDQVKRKKLDAIMIEPMLLKIRKEMIGKKWVIILNGALLAESGFTNIANNNIVLVDTDDKSQEERLLWRWLTSEQIDHRVSSQFSADAKKQSIRERIYENHYGTLTEIDNSSSSNETVISEAFTKMVSNIDVFGELRIKSILAELEMRERYGEIIAQVKSLYDWPERMYHNWFHIVASIQELLQIRELLTSSEFAELFYAILFHDTIYNATAQKRENESNSAILADQYLQKRWVGTETCKRVHELILLTGWHMVDDENDLIGKYMIDIDLAILWQDRETYYRYAKAIRREYIHYPDHLYMPGSAWVMKDIFKKQLYQTPYFQKKYDMASIYNIWREIALIESGKL